MSGPDAIGVLKTGPVTERGYLDLLSEPERERCATMTHPGHRQRWIGGRLVAKHLLLTRLGSRGADGAPPWPPRVRLVDPAALREFPAWAYREIAILPRRRTEGGVPRITWAGCVRPVRVSLAHASQFSCACLDDFRAVGLDLEVPRARIPAFYRVNFSPAERRWVEVLVASGQSDVDRAYTLLWCLKESALKMGRSDEASLWQLPRIEVRLRCDPWLLGHTLRSGSLSGPLLRSEAEIYYGSETRRAEAAIAASPDAVLTMLRLR